MEDLFNDDSILDIVLEGFTGEYLQKNTALKQMVTSPSTELW